MSAFDDIERVGDEPASHLISRADYLNLSARPEAARVRALVDNLLDHYPTKDQDALIRRIRSRDDSRHRSGWFELLLHGLLLTHGFTVVEIEPILPNGRSPDFLVQAPDGRDFFLEATVAEGEIGADPGALRRLRDVLQVIDDVQSANFFIDLHHRGVPTEPVKISTLRKRVQSFLDGLDYDAIATAFAAKEPTPLLRLEEHGLVLTIAVVPKNVRQIGGRAIGGRVLPGGLITPNVPIKAAVESKAGRYGPLDKPYLIAVCAVEEFAHPDAFVDALFGTLATAVSPRGDHRWVRNADGAWHGPSGPVNTRVSAVLATERLSPWDVGQRRMRLIHNPWAARPLLDLPLGVDVQQVVDGRLRTLPGQSLADIFHLPAGWPGSDED